MKLKSYKILFRVVSYLTDKTGGTPLLVKYKIALGTFLIGASGISCVGQTPRDASSHNTIPITAIDSLEDDFYNDRITCYDPVAPIISIKAKVVDKNNNPLENISVSLNGDSYSKEITNQDGEFEINAMSGDTLVFVGDGYSSKKININDLLDDKLVLLEKEIPLPPQISCYMTTIHIDIKEQE